jgi:hypothetical protein
VAVEAAVAVAESHGYEYAEASPLTGLHVKSTLTLIASRIPIREVIR